MDFKIDKKGYNRTQVDEYILTLIKNYEQAAARQSELIDELKRKLAESENKNKAYRDRESLISGAITSAVAKADEIDRLSKLKYSREMQQLKAFHEKWLGYYERILKKYPLDGELMSVSRFNEEMTRILEKARATSEGAGETQEAQDGAHGSETRIGYTVISTDEKEDGEGAAASGAGDGLLPDDFDPVDRIRSFLGKKKEAHRETVESEETEESSAQDDYSDRSPSGFSFQEALNPKEDLEDIMRELGLLKD